MKKDVFEFHRGYLGGLGARPFHRPRVADVESYEAGYEAGKADRGERKLVRFHVPTYRKALEKWRGIE